MSDNLVLEPGESIASAVADRRAARDHSWTR